MKPAWYVYGGGLVGDFLALTHPPYTAWHLSYVVMGISLAPKVFLDRSVAVLAAFLLGLGLGAHALDESQGHPLKTRFSDNALRFIAVTTIGGATVIGLFYAVTLTPLILFFVVVESFIAFAYNLEWFNGKFHNPIIFALGWGSMPLLTAFYVNALTLNLPALLMAIAAGGLSLVQYVLSNYSKILRRRIAPVKALQLEDDTSIPITTSDLIDACDNSLKLLTVSVIVIALTLLSLRF